MRVMKTLGMASMRAAEWIINVTMSVAEWGNGQMCLIRLIVVNLRNYLVTCHLIFVIFVSIK
jgi:hypothetical protein